MRTASDRHCTTRENLGAAGAVAFVALAPALLQLAEAWLPPAAWAALGAASFLALVGGALAYVLTGR